jgi:hypothetical protein
MRNDVDVTDTKSSTKPLHPERGAREMVALKPSAQCISAMRARAGGYKWRDLVTSVCQTVASGVAGEPAAPGTRNVGPVNKNRLRPWARGQMAGSVSQNNSPG